MASIYEVGVRTLTERPPEMGDGELGMKASKVELLNIDCMEYMATQPDNAFDLAIDTIATLKYNTQMIESNEIQIGKAGEYITCADLIMKGFIAYPSEQGLPYDVVIDNGRKLLKCQVKTTAKRRTIPQRNKESQSFIFNVKRKGKNGKSRYTPDDVDLFALVELENRTVAYVEAENLPTTMILRVDSLRGTYYDEQGAQDYKKVRFLLDAGKTQTEASKIIGKAIATVNRMAKPGYKPHITSAKYFSDLYREKEWFYGL